MPFSVFLNASAVMSGASSFLLPPDGAVSLTLSPVMKLFAGLFPAVRLNLLHDSYVLEPPKGFEPSTCRLQDGCSAC